MSEFAEAAAECKGTKEHRPNFKSMGLNVRALQNAGNLKYQIPHHKPNPDYDLHADYPGFGPTDASSVRRTRAPCSKCTRVH